MSKPIQLLLGALLFLPQFLVCQDAKLLAQTVVKALAQKDTALFQSCFLQSSDMRGFFLAKFNIKNASPEQLDRFDSVAKLHYPEYLFSITDLYTKISNSQLKLKWEELLVDSVELTTTESPDIKTGVIYLRTTNSLAFYKINLPELLYTGSKCRFSSMYLPHYYIGPKNRQLTAHLKRRYVDSCVIQTKRMRADEKDPKIKALLNQDKCLPCSCERQYFSDTDQSDGVKRIKQRIDFVFKPKPKAK